MTDNFSNSDGSFPENALEKCRFSLNGGLPKFKPVTAASCSGAAAPTVRKSCTLRATSTSRAGAMM